ncbi:MAG: hypothetical protein IJ017_05505 [Oscillospiraceae bacterium]|nr:hypothetical protein [Oscillospiraceae bacterium]
MKWNNIKDNLWKYVFPVLAIILWIATIVLFFTSHRGYDINDYESFMPVMNAMRWQPACFIGAIISTAAAFVIEERH